MTTADEVNQTVDQLIDQVNRSGMDETARRATVARIERDRAAKLEKLEREELRKLCIENDDAGGWVR